MEMLDIIQSVGFPIGVCLVCFLFINQLISENRNDNQKREELLFSQIGEISKTMAEISKTLALIDERIEKLERKGEKNNE